MMDFYKTGGGRRFCDSTVPELVKQMTRLADEMHKANLLKEMELRTIGETTNPGDIAQEFVTVSFTEEEEEFMKATLSLMASGTPLCCQNGNDLIILKNPNILKELKDNGYKVKFNNDGSSAIITVIMKEG
jgi:hypothetical protein